MAEPQSHRIGIRPPEPGPLSRFVPPLEAGTPSKWLLRVAQAGNWILDPFGIAPQLALEAARRGYRVLVTANNPITRFLLEMAAAPPSEADFKGGLADLAVSRRGDERLEAHIQSLYLTACESCGRDIQAESFLWRKGEDAPYARLYACPYCEDSGERPVTPADVERARQMAAADTLHRSRSLERVASRGDEGRQFAEDAMRHYLPRPLYVITTILNRLEALDLSPARRRALTGLILFACDAGNTLWGIPHERARPKQLTIPAQFREFNLWLALETAMEFWSLGGQAVALEVWPKPIPETGGICLFEGRLRDLAHQVRREVPIAAAVGALPRSNQAFWTLSALWAGWLWGRAALEPFQVALRRRRYDWAWSTTALHAAFAHLFELLPLGTPVHGLLPEPEPQFVSAALVAADAAGLDLQELNVRSSDEPVGVFWQRGERLRRAAQPLEKDLISTALQTHLRERGEPAPYLHLHAAGVAALDQAQALRAPDQPFDETLRNINGLMQSSLAASGRFVHYSTGEGLDTGVWGPQPSAALPEGNGQTTDSLADRLEAAVVSFLQASSPCSFSDLLEDLGPAFPGLLAPPSDLVHAIVASYAERLEDGRWQLRSEDALAARREDFEHVGEAVAAIGRRLGFTVRRDGSLMYWEEEKAVLRLFLLLTSARIGRALSEYHLPPGQLLIVIPGGRAALVAFKADRDPALRQRVEPYRLVKYRLLRAMARLPVLSRETFEEQIASDPVELARGQMLMF